MANMNTYRDFGNALIGLLDELICPNRPSRLKMDRMHQHRIKMPSGCQATGSSKMDNISGRRVIGRKLKATCFGNRRSMFIPARDIALCPAIGITVWKTEVCCMPRFISLVLCGTIRAGVFGRALQSISALAVAGLGVGAASIVRFSLAQVAILTTSATTSLLGTWVLAIA